MTKLEVSLRIAVDAWQGHESDSEPTEDFFRQVSLVTQDIVRQQEQSGKQLFKGEETEDERVE